MSDSPLEAALGPPVLLEEARAYCTPGLTSKALEPCGEALGQMRAVRVVRSQGYSA